MSGYCYRVNIGNETGSAATGSAIRGSAMTGAAATASVIREWIRSGKPDATPRWGFGDTVMFAIIENERILLMSECS